MGYRTEASIPRSWYLTKALAQEGAIQIPTVVFTEPDSVLELPSKKEKAHIDVSSKEWAEFVVGQRSFADRDKTVAAFESVLARPSVPETSEALDDQLEDVAEEVDDSSVH